MKYLEKKLYIFSVEAIGWAKSMEKITDQPALVENFKYAAANAYKRFSEAIASEDNKDFASKLRASNKLVKQAGQLLRDLTTEDETLSRQKTELDKQKQDIETSLEEITKKIIY